MTQTAILDNRSIDIRTLTHRFFDASQIYINSSGTQWIAIPHEQIYTSSISENQAEGVLELLKVAGCTIIDEISVKKFLTEHIGLSGSISLAPKKIYEKFGSSRVKVEIRNDPDNNDDKQLFMYVEFNGDSLTALKKLDELDDEWLLNLSIDESLYFNVNVEYK